MYTSSNEVSRKIRPLATLLSATPPAMPSRLRPVSRRILTLAPAARGPRLDRERVGGPSHESGERRNHDEVHKGEHDASLKLGEALSGSLPPRPEAFHSEFRLRSA